MVSRVDDPASRRKALGIGVASLLLVGVAAGTACGVQAICHDEGTARTAGLATLGSVGAALVAGIVLFAACDACWTVK